MMTAKDQRMLRLGLVDVVGLSIFLLSWIWDYRTVKGIVAIRDRFLAERIEE
jgi:hypothetical protein